MVVPEYNDSITILNKGFQAAEIDLNANKHDLQGNILWSWHENCISNDGYKMGFPDSPLFHPLF